MTATMLSANPMSEVVRLGILTTLMEPVAMALNNLTTLQPAERVLAAARAMNGACEHNPRLRELMVDVDVVNVLRTEVLRRRGEPADVLGPPLKDDVVPTQRPAEGGANRG